MIDFTNCPAHLLPKASPSAATTAGSSMSYPDHQTYASLYARYLRGDRTAQLLDAAGSLQGKDVVDVCAGGGRLSRLALARGARVTAVDESADMAKELPAGITKHVRSVDSWLWAFWGRAEFDAIFCQQAINYWLKPELARDLSEILRAGGVFVFNTFNKEPSRVPAVKQYELDGVHFAEVSWLSGIDTVEHVQVREGEPPHTTRFRWISPEQFHAWLSPHFQVDERRDGASSVWVCHKRGS